MRPIDLRTLQESFTEMRSLVGGSNEDIQSVLNLLKVARDIEQCEISSSSFTVVFSRLQKLEGYEALNSQEMSLLVLKHKIIDFRSWSCSEGYSSRDFQMAFDEWKNRQA